MKCLHIHDNIIIHSSENNFNKEQKNEKIISLILAMFLIVSPQIAKANYDEALQNDNSLIKQSMDNFVNKRFSEIQDNLGNNVTASHKAKVLELYYDDNLSELKNYLLDNKLSLSWYDGISTRASLGKNSSKKFYKLYRSTNYGSIQKEWVVRLSGTFYYDQNRKVVVSVGKPTLSIEVASFGSGFKPYLSGVKTTGVKNGSYGAKFSASYTMKATMNIKQSGVPISGTVNFHKDTVSYTDSL